MSKILLTGVSGFVGSTVWEYLQNQYELKKLQVRKEFTEADFLDVDVIIHIAGKAHDLKNTSNPEEYYKVNFELTKKLFDFFLESEISKFIFISSVKAVADNAVQPLTEGYIPKPLTHYGKSKLMAEEYIKSIPLPPSKSYYILRPCMIHGPGNNGNLKLLVKLISKGLPWPLGAFINQRSFLSIDNLSFTIRELIASTNIPSGIYNVADSETLSTNELIKIMATEFNINPMIINVPKKIINSIARIGDILHLPLNSDRLSKLTECYIVSNQKLIDAIQKPLPVNAVDGIIKTIRSFKY